MKFDKNTSEPEKTVQIELNQNLEKIKKCSKCKKLLPIKHFYHVNRTKDGYDTQCRKCRLDCKNTQLQRPLVSDEKYQSLIDLVKKREENEKILKDGFKICNLCNRKLLFSEFAKNIRRAGGFNDECRDCVSKRGAARYEERGFSAPERINTIRNGAKKIKLPYDIDQKFLEEKFTEQCGLCFYSKLLMTKTVGKSNTASVDRIQASKGYTRDNVVLCCDSVNSMKNSMSYETFVELCENIVVNKLSITDALRKSPEEKHWRLRASDKR